MIRTIIVDDDAAILAEMKDLLEGERVFEIAGIYTDPLMALEEAIKIKPECVFLDIELVGMSGIELAQKLLSINPHMDIIFATDCNNYAAQAFAVNATDYILKPVMTERLKKTLEKLMKRRASTCEDKYEKCTIRSFGNFEVSVGGQNIKWKRSKTKELFALLLQWQGKSVTKYKLCELLWTNLSQEQALANLQTSIWAIRKNLRDLGFQGIKIEYYDDRYFIKLDMVDWDVLEFEWHYQAFKKLGSTEELGMALGHYTGEYLEGEDWLWAYALRENYRNLYKGLLDKTQVR